MIIREWLQMQLIEENHRQLLSWYDKKEKIVAIKWKHASYQDYQVADSHLFKEWAQQNGHLDTSLRVENREEMKRWKTNFRCALEKAVNVIKVDPVTRKRSKLYRYYKLLDSPDPEKLSKKKAENRNAIISKRKPKDQRRRYVSRKIRSRHRSESETTSSTSELESMSSADEAGTAETEQLLRPAVVQLLDEEQPAAHCWLSLIHEYASTDHRSASGYNIMHYDTLDVGLETEVSSGADHGDYDVLCQAAGDITKTKARVLVDTGKVIVEQMPNGWETNLHFLDL